MADQETFVANAAESTLSSSLAQAATSVNVTSTTGFPSVPFYATIDPDDDSKREVVRATAKTATTLTIVRGEDNSSDVAHDSGAVIAVVPVAAHWTDINDRVDAADTALSNHQSAFGADHGADHDARDHDALNIDAATLGGNAASAFAAVAGDTFTGAMVFDAGLDAKLSDDGIAATDAHGSWPLGLSWQRVTSAAAWPDTGWVVTHNFGDDARTTQTFYVAIPSGVVDVYVRRWQPSPVSWSSWATLVMAENPGIWEVDNSTEVSGDQNQTTTYADYATVTLNIPSDWGSWRCEAYATFSWGQVSSTTSLRYFTIQIDGSNQQEMAFSNSEVGTRFGSIGGRRTGMTTTGSRTVSLRTKVSSTSGTPRISDVYLYARAVRTS